MPLPVIEDLCIRMGSLEYRHGQLVKKVIQVSDAEVADGIAIGEIGPRVSTVGGQVVMETCVEIKGSRFPRWVEAKVVSSEVESEEWRRLLLYQMCVAIDATTDDREEDFFPQNGKTCVNGYTYPDVDEGWFEREWRRGASERGSGEVLLWKNADTTPGTRGLNEKIIERTGERMEAPDEALEEMDEGTGTPFCRVWEKEFLGSEAKNTPSDISQNNILIISLDQYFNIKVLLFPSNQPRRSIFPQLAERMNSEFIIKMERRWGKGGEGGIYAKVRRTVAAGLSSNSVR
ncbi:hypothetical protein Tco_1220483 [Tanacetum coccineum]